MSQNGKECSRTVNTIPERKKPFRNGIKHRACFHEYVITESGKHLRKGFQMLTERKYFYCEIVDYLIQRGVEISTKNFRNVFSNPFYAGYVT